MRVYIIYVTAADREEAHRIGTHLVRERLAACVNIFDQMNSIYIWEGKLQDDHEAVMIAKTVEAKVPEVIAAVRRLHSYTCPCVLALPVADGNPDFLSWIYDQVNGRPDSA